MVSIADTAYGVQVSAACGGASRHLKQYQVAGVNFMLLLARAGVDGSILAGEQQSPTFVFDGMAAAAQPVLLFFWLASSSRA